MSYFINKIDEQSVNNRMLRYVVTKRSNELTDAHRSPQNKLRVANTQYRNIFQK